MASLSSVSHGGEAGHKKWHSHPGLGLGRGGDGLSHLFGPGTCSAFLQLSSVPLALARGWSCGLFDGRLTLWRGVLASSFGRQRISIARPSARKGEVGLLVHLAVDAYFGPSHASVRSARGMEFSFTPSSFGLIDTPRPPAGGVELADLAHYLAVARFWPRWPRPSAVGWDWPRRPPFFGNQGIRVRVGAFGLQRVRVCGGS